MAFKTLEPKDPNSEGIDYMVDLAALRNGRGTQDYLQDGEFIDENAMKVEAFSDDPSLVIDDFYVTDSNSSITIILSGGTVNTFSSVTARFKTTLGRKVDRSFRIFIKNL
ncbi:hypothetical protein [uncultured Paraglaciecola sp.]|uniref:phage fiber-tail adaptor protein n=1 Tax=uncultured Paraglaciecola sp. TaxID=1765024 RepID=UPI00262259CF|nr:hypothetical protein [uncultured Paraglaciecola sp.]